MGEIFRVIVPEGDASFPALQELKQKLPGSTRVKIIESDNKIPGQTPHRSYLFHFRESSEIINYEVKEIQ
ncbi:MAG: hypothetical protein Q7R97_02165 [Candidatus Daviesbacteria bacterium]|nr:hypothetical protein [Candidatus Daviesbacteria bacterium]